MAVNKLNPQQITIIKNIFEKDFNKKLEAIKGNVSVLMELSRAIGQGTNYSIVQSNLKSCI